MTSTSPRGPLLKITPRERFNSYSHIAAALFFLLVTAYLTYRVARAGDLILILATLVYGLGIFSVYFASAFYHVAYDAPFKAKARILDHYGLFISFAATYTPLLLVSFAQHFWALVLCIALWVLAGLGIYYETHLGKNNYQESRKKSFGVALAMTLLSFALLPALFITYDSGALALYFSGVLSSLIGFVYYLKSKKYPAKDVLYHGAWHVLGFLSSFFFLLFYYATLYRYF